MPEPLVLDAIHQRLLQWLRHYPFQRLEDLVVAQLAWCGRTTVYTHLKDLECARLVETLHGPLCAGKALFHLAPAGLAWSLTSAQAEGSVLDAQALREAIASERTRLLRLAPRVPTWLTLQTTMNGLVCGAADALTQQGRRAHLVRWNWQRDVSHVFLSREHALRWFADGLGACCVRTATTAGKSEERWYGFFLLALPLTHPHLLRARLDRLLRWRESEERWPAYTQMPVILVLAASERQASWWHEAAERVIQELGVAPPLGAVVSLNAKDGAPWAWAWKRLGSQRACHLRDLFLPQEASGFPDLFPQETRSALEQTAMSVPLAHTHLYQLARVRTARHAGQQRPRADRREWRRASLHLSPRAWEILWLLQAHPLLSRENLCAHLHLERSSLAHLLAPLVRAGLFARYPTRMGERFALAEGGLRVLAAATHCQVRYLAHRPGHVNEPDSSADVLLPRGLPGLLKQAEHIAGVYGFFDALASLECLRWWETGAICARFYQHQGQWYGLRPDAVAACQAGERTFRFWLEWDRGTMREGELRRKMRAYTRYLSSHAWAREHLVPPALLCVALDVAHERLLARVARAQLASCPVHVAVYTTTRHLLLKPGIVAAIWRQVWPLQAEAGPEALVLLPIFDERAPQEIASLNPQRKDDVQ